MKEILLTIAVLIFLSQNATAEEWLCTTESGQRVGNTILSCGIGESLNDEALARRRALENAIEEFQTICQMSVDCYDKKRIMEPKRTQCTITKQGLTKCYRLIEVRLVE